MATSEVQRRNVELARSGLEDWIAGRRDRAIATFAEDLEVHVPPELGNAGTYRGLDGFARWNSSWEDAWSSIEYEVRRIEPVGERHAIVLVHSRGVGRGSGIEVENELGWVMGIAEDRLAYLSLQPDLEHARALAIEREGA